MTIFDDLEAEQQRLDDILASLDERQWASPSQAEGWTIADVVLHLAHSEEAVVFTARPEAARSEPARPDVNLTDRPPGLSVDGFAAQAVQNQRTTTEPVLPRWRQARTAALAALRAADPERPLRWVEAPLKPATLATTRLAEHWAHGLDIAVPLGFEFPDNERLRNVAWL
ncbi:MAG: maleylpyruvate isomerase N-terminal domain-containing protein, partial [Streptosporangiaceae bacterium]